MYFIEHPDRNWVFTIGSIAAKGNEVAGETCGPAINSMFAEATQGQPIRSPS
jgi:hypothetical protein